MSANRLLKLIVSGLISSSLLIGQVTFAQTAGCAGFPDVSYNSEYCVAITYTKQIGVMTGNDDGTFTPYGDLSRAEAAAILVRYMELPLPTEYPLLASFDDADVNQWYAPYFEALLRMRVFEGYPDGTLQPGRVLARSEWIKLWYKAQGLEVDKTLTAQVLDVPANADTEWFRYYLYDAVVNEYLELQEGYFKPSEPQKRNLASSLIYLFDENYQGVIHDPNTSYVLPTSDYALGLSQNFGLVDSLSTPLQKSELGSGWSFSSEFFGSHDGSIGTNAEAVKKK